MRRVPLLVLLLGLALHAALRESGSRGALRAEDPPAAPAPPEAPLVRLIGPRRGPEKAKALAANGGTAATEKAVEAGLDWLARHRTEAGLWDADGFSARCAAPGPACTGPGKGQHGEAVPCPFDEAVSALAALAFLGAGHAPSASEGYGPLLEQVLMRLSSVGETWALPLATEALAEAEVLDGKGRWSAAVRTNVQRLLAARQPDGAWGYAAPYRAGSDVPFTALVVPALLAARDAGAELPSDLGAQVDAWLSTLEEDRGRLAYLADGRRYGYTPTTCNAHAALLLRELLETGTQGARHKAHAALVASEKPIWKIAFKVLEVPGRGKVQTQVGSLSMYAWWMGTLGEFQRGGGPWSAWFGAAKSALLGHQRADGCARGSWDPEGTYERQTGGRVFATALGVLMLEQPYRHRRLSAR